MIGTKIKRTDLAVEVFTLAQSRPVNGSSNLILIARKEVADNFRTWRAAIATAIMLAMFVLSVYFLAADYRQRETDWQINQAALQYSAASGRVAYNLPEGTFHYSIGITAALPLQPPQPMSALVKGVDAEMGRPISMRQQIAFGPLSRSVAGPTFDTPDTFFMAKLLISLFALILSLGAITREKEAGTLRATLAQTVRRRVFILGKACGATATLLICLTVPFLGQLLCLKLADWPYRDPQQMVRVLLLFGFAALYGIVFVLLGLFISTMVARTQSAIIVSLLGWVTIVLMLPNAAVLLANLLSPASTYNQLNARLYEARQQIINPRLKENPSTKSVFDLPNAREVIFQTFETDRRITDEFLDAKLRQVELARRLSALSPAGALSSGQSSLAGTGISAYTQYVQFLRAQRDRVIEALERRWDMPAAEGARLVDQTMQEIDRQQRPSEGLKASLQAAALPLVSLLLWAAALGAAAVWRFERYDVR